jgi:hypothetical protein
MFSRHLNQSDAPSIERTRALCPQDNNVNCTIAPLHDMSDLLERTDAVHIILCPAAFEECMLVAGRNKGLPPPLLANA